MVADITCYAGREQAYVKHYFLENYLGRLIHKTAGAFDHIVYIDGFSGPWQSAGEQFKDTSFGIALGELRKAKVTWEGLGRKVQMSAFLVEKRKDAFRRLQEVPGRFPDISVRPYQGDFVDVSSRLLNDIPTGSFAFLFIDPKGWKIPLARIAPLLRWPNAEVVFNFMFEFINRAASMSDPQLAAALDELIPLGGWRTDLAALDQRASRKEAPEARKAILVDGFKDAVRALGNYQYAMDTPVLRPLKDRMLYSLVYATRKPIGVEVFRDCQIKTLREQESVRGTVKIAHTQKESKQGEMFKSMGDMTSDDTDRYLATEQLNARDLLCSLVPEEPLRTTYGELWPAILAQHAVRKTDLNRLAGELFRLGQLRSLNWLPRQRVPGNDTVFQRAGATSRA